MPFNVSNFKAQIDKFGYLQNNKFEVYINPPVGLLNAVITTDDTENSVSNIVKMLSFRIEDVVAPGIAQITADVSRYGIGPTQKYPINSQFSEINFSAISDKYGEIWNFWHQWAKLTFGFTGTEATSGASSYRHATYTANFKEEYATTMQIIVYNNLGFDVLKINLYEAYPVSVRDNILSWSDNNELLNISVNITFKEYTIVKSSLTYNQERESEYIRDSYLPSSITYP